MKVGQGSLIIGELGNVLADFAVYSY